MDNVKGDKIINNMWYDEVDIIWPPWDREWTVYVEILFNKVTKDMNLWDKIYKLIGRDDRYLMKMMSGISWDNSINFRHLDISVSALKHIKARLSKKWIIKYLKLWDKKINWYLNPLVQLYGNRMDIELIRAFSEYNTKLWYEWYKNRYRYKKKL